MYIKNNRKALNNKKFEVRAHMALLLSLLPLKNRKKALSPKKKSPEGDFDFTNRNIN